MKILSLKGTTKNLNDILDFNSQSTGAIQEGFLNRTEHISNSFNANEDENSINNVYKFTKYVYKDNILRSESNFSYPNQTNLLYNFNISQIQEN